MLVSPQLFAVVALCIAVATWAVYLVAIARSKLSGLPWGSMVLMLAALGGGGFAIASQPTAPVIAPAAVGMVMSGLFLWLLSVRKTPIGDIRVSVGDSLMPFAAQLGDGTQFKSGSLTGQRILLKFFRGSW